ncbi:MAG: response regulator with CheY-like receiver domain and winged-helix DNA-binding domain [Clostridiales bacterium]|nr:response regulator with CheY-like receiver domain and winged-helix DNA-binding domain [Clostridiales bacterium]MDF2595344.1 response regulator with CheY-like receiver domain and winged-helix DNA-binding domain [Clostridia bacterium]
MVSSEELFHEVWGDEYFANSNNTVMVHIRHIREKMHDSIERPQYIKDSMGDADKLARVFNNILKNAIVYSYKNSVIDILAQQQEKIVL